MRLWHYQLIPHLPDRQLCGQNRECLALLGGAWGKKHASVNYVFVYTKHDLVEYFKQIRDQMFKRALRKALKEDYEEICSVLQQTHEYKKIYLEHDDIYLSFCLHNLKYAISHSTGKQKGIDLFFHFDYIIDCGHYDKDEEYKYLNNTYTFV